MLGHGEYYEEGPEEVVRDALLHRPIWDIFPRISKLEGEEPLIFVHHIGEIREKLLRTSRRFYSE